MSNRVYPYGMLAAAQQFNSWDGPASVYVNTQTGEVWTHYFGHADDMREANAVTRQGVTLIASKTTGPGKAYAGELRVAARRAVDENRLPKIRKLLKEADLNG